MGSEQKDSIIVCNSCRCSVATAFKFCGNERLVASLRENPRALPAEAACVREEIKDASRAVDVLDKEIAAASATVKAPKRRRSSVATFISQKKSVIAPIRQLPVEILLDIFSLVCTKNRFAYWDGAERCTPTIDISQTCSFWRSLCLTRPDLWTSISTVAFNKPSFCPDMTYQDDSSLFNLYLERTGDRLLDVDIGGAHDGWPPFISRPDRKMAEELLGVMDRAKNLRINSGLLDEFYPDGFKLGDESPIKNLEVIMDRYQGLQEFSTVVKHSFLGASITNVSLDGIIVTCLELQWKLVKTVALGKFTLYGLQALADVANEITCLHLNNMASKQHPFTGDKILFPKLTRLTFGNLFEKGNPDVLPRIDCSGLRELELRDGSSQSLNAVSEAFCSPAGSSHPLCRFSLYDSDVDMKHLRSTLQSFTNIQYLNLDFLPRLRNRSLRAKKSVTSEDISTFLSVSGDTIYQSSFLPELTELSITGGRVIIDSRIVGFLESRRRGDVHKCLERIVFSHEEPDLNLDNMDKKRLTSEVVCESEALLGRLRELREDGLHICINSDWSPLSDLLCLN